MHATVPAPAVKIPAPRRPGILATLFTLLLPWYLVHAYRLVPGRVRSLYRFAGFRSSSSHMALDWMAQGVPGWTAFWVAFERSPNP